MYACIPAALVGSAAAAISARSRRTRPVTSRRGDESGAHERTILEVDDPGRALLEPALPRLDDTPLDKLFDELPDDVAMRAEHHLVQLCIADELHRARQAVALGQRRRLLERKLAHSGQRFDGLDAAQKRAGVNGGDREWREDLDQRLGLLDSLLAQRTLAVIAGPVPPAAGLRVTHDVKRPHLVRVRASTDAAACGPAPSRPSAISPSLTRPRCAPSRSAHQRRMHG